MQYLMKLLGISSKQANPEEMTFPVAKVLGFFCVALATILLASNLAALKVWNLFGIPFDAGILLFPIAYIVGDLLVDIFGQKIANLVSLYCSIFAVFIVVILGFAKVALADFPGVDNSAFNIVQGATGRVFLASVVGFLAGQFVNNGVFVKIRAKQINKNVGFIKRALLSSVVAHFFDSLAFETLAFLGRVPFSDFLLQIAFAYFAGLALEVILSPITAILAQRLRTRLKYSDGKILS